MTQRKRIRLGDIMAKYDDHKGKRGNALFWVEFYLDEAKANLSDEPMLAEARERAGRLAQEAAISGDAQTLRDLANLLDGKKPKKRLFTEAQRNILVALEDYCIEHGHSPSSQTELIAYSEQCDICDPITPSVLSGFPVHLPIGRGTPGRRTGD